MPETFQDGFPIIPSEAIEFSYFFSEEEKQEWREWLETASLEEKNELVDMLHKIWLDKQKQVVPNQFAVGQEMGQPISQAATNQDQNYYNQTPQFQVPQNLKNSFPDYSQTAPTGNLNTFPAIPAIPQVPTETPFQPETKTQPEPTQIPNLPELNSFNQLPVQKNEEMETQQNIEDVDDFNFDFNFDDFESDDEPKKEDADDSINNEVDYLPEISPEEIIEQKPEPKPEITPKPAFSIAKVRETATKEELKNLYENYTNSRQAKLKAARQNDQSYDELFGKLVSIILTFEQVADHLEFMTSKLNDMNQLIIEQAKELENYQNQQRTIVNNLEQKDREISSKLDLIDKKYESKLEQYDTRIENVKAGVFGAYTPSEVLMAQLDSLKGKIAKIEKSAKKPEKEVKPTEN